MKKITISSIVIFIILFLSFITLTYGLEIIYLGEVSEKYDDNMLSANKDKKNDFITSIDAGIGLRHEGQNQYIQFTGNVIQQIYARYHDASNNSQNFHLNYRADLSKYDQLNLKNDFIHALEASDFESEFNRGAKRYWYYQNNLSASYSRDIFYNFRITALYLNGLYKNTEEDTSDSYYNSIGLTPAYTWNSKNITSMIYSYSQREFKPGNKALVNSTALQHRHYFTQILFFDCKGGVDYIKSYDDKKYIKPNISSSIVYDLNENSRFSLLFSKQHSINSLSENIYNTWTIAGELKQQMSENFRFSVTTFYGYGKYVNDKIYSKFIGSTLSTYYNIKEKITFDISYTFRKNYSNIQSSEYVRNNLSLALKAEF
jgi:hypothetical protein